MSNYDAHKLAADMLDDLGVPQTAQSMEVAMVAITKRDRPVDEDALNRAVIAIIGRQPKLPGQSGTIALDAAEAWDRRRLHIIEKLRPLWPTTVNDDPIICDHCGEYTLLCHGSAYAAKEDSLRSAAKEAASACAHMLNEDWTEHDFLDSLQDALRPHWPADRSDREWKAVVREVGQQRDQEMAARRDARVALQRETDRSAELVAELEKVAQGFRGAVSDHTLSEEAQAAWVEAAECLDPILAAHRRDG